MGGCFDPPEALCHRPAGLSRLPGASAKRSLPGHGADSGRCRCSQHTIIMGAIVQRGAPSMADVAYGTVHAMNTVQARKLLVKTYRQTQSIRETARRWHTSRQVVRRWVRRFRAQSETGLHDLSRRPHHSPRKTLSGIEEQERELRRSTRYDRERPTMQLKHQGIDVSPHTIRHILRRIDPTWRKYRHRRAAQITVVESREPTEPTTKSSIGPTYPPCSTSKTRSP